MRSIKSRLLVFSLTLSILPTVIVGISSWTFSKNIIREKTNTLAMASLEQTADKIDNQIKQINLYFEVLSNIESLTSRLRVTDFEELDINIYRTYLAIDPVFRLIVPFPEVVSGVTFFSNAGGAYNLNTYFTDGEAESGTDWYRAIVANGDNTSWIGPLPSPVLEQHDESVFYVGKNLWDLTKPSDIRVLGVLVFFVNADRILKYPEIGDGPALRFFGKNGSPIRPRDGDVDAMAETEFDKIWEGVSGSFPAEIEERRHHVLFQTIDTTQWKIVQYIPDEYYSRDLRTTGIFTIVVVIMTAAAVFVLSRLLSNGISRPILTLADAFVTVGRNDFSVKLDEEGTGEIAVIIAGFNKMTTELQQLFDDAIERERVLNSAELKALQYQINPHFIYNSISTIRFSALRHNNEELAQMLSALTRLFKNTVTRTAEMLSVGETVDNLRDYISIIQMQYHNRLRVDVRVEPGLDEWRIPVLMIQPVVENAINHGLSTRLNREGGNAVLDIWFEKFSGGIMVTIRDNGVGIDREKARQVMSMDKNLDDREVRIGLINIQERICHRFGGEYGLEIDSRKGEYTAVIIRLPELLPGEERDA